MTETIETASDLTPTTVVRTAERYLYAIVPAGTTAVALGSALDGAEIELVNVSGVSAVVGPVPRSMDEVAAALGGDPQTDARHTLVALEAAVRDHERVVERLLVTARSVVPIRFGTVVSSPHAVRDLLARHSVALATRLEMLQGRREWGLTVHWESEAAAELAAHTQGTTAPQSAEEDSGPGQRFFAAKRRERAMAEWLRSACAAVASGVEEALGPLADLQMRLGSGLDVTRTTICVLVASALVAADDEERFTAELEGVMRRNPGLSASLSGPWPPYSFVGPLALETW